jgi:hypothetical protein
MILRLKVWPTAELAKASFVSDGKVLQVRYADLDLRTFAPISQLTGYARELLWDDFFKNDPETYSKVGEITTDNIEAFSEDRVALNEWINHLFKASLSKLNNEWLQSTKPQEEDPGF